MALGEVLAYALVVLFLPRDTYGEADTYVIPMTFNPLIQNSIKKGENTELFYDSDKKFYSKVTVIDAAKNTEQHVKHVITKTISVVFLTIASSHVSGSLKLNDLRHTKPSKWSYTLTVQSILDASNGAIPTFSDAMVLYKIQENAMKVLERRYGFSASDILAKLGLTKMEFYGVDEKQWIDVVGIVTDKVITNRTEKLNLTSCYLAEMVNKTVAEIQAFTLNEVDMYLYNTSMLIDKLPAYRNTVISSLYRTFNITESQLASMSNIDISLINTMQLKDVIQLFTTSILKQLQVSKDEITQSDGIFQPEMLLSCTDKWEPFNRLAISKSFDNAAKNMSIASQTLVSLIEISYTDVKTVNQMLSILATIIQPLKEDKIMVETFTLHKVLTIRSSETLNNTKDNAFAAIQMFTNFTTRQLTLLYGWNEQDYQFAKMFTLNDISNVCSFNPYYYDLLTLATINVGNAHSLCSSFNVLREIWQKKSVNDLESKFSTSLPFDQPIPAVISWLTKAPLTISYRLLNITPEVQEVVQEITFNNITAVTTYSDSTLKKKSLQDIIELAVHLHKNGSFHHTVKLVSFSVITSLTPSLLLIPTRNIRSTTANYENNRTQLITKSTQLYSPKSASTVISTFTLEQTPSINISDHSYNTKMLNKQSTVIRNISQAAVSITEELSYIYSKSGTQLTSSHYAVINTSEPSSLPSKTNSAMFLYSERFPTSNSNQRFSSVTSTTLTFQNPSLSTSHSKSGTQLTSSHYAAKNATEPSSQQSKTNSAMFLYSERFSPSNSNKRFSSVTSTVLTLHNLSPSISHSKSSTQLRSYYTYTTPPLVTTIARPNSTKMIKSPSFTPSSYPLKNTIINMTPTYADAAVTSRTKVMTYTTTAISSPTDSTTAFSNGETDLSTTVSPKATPYSSSPTTIYLIIQTTQSSIPSSIRSSNTAIVIAPTSTMITTKHHFISQASATTETMISKAMSDTPSYFTTVRASSYPRISSTYLPTNATSTLLPIYPLPTSQTRNTMESIQPSTTKLETMSSSATKPVDICRSTSACRDDQVQCISDSGKFNCKNAKNLIAQFTITKGATFISDLLIKSSEAFKNLSRQMEYLIDSVYKESMYSSAYYGSKVIEFNEGSVIVLYKLSFKTSFSVSNSTMENITNILKDSRQLEENALGNNLKIGDIDPVKDFDECSSGNTNECYKTANCYNTLGSYNCVCPTGTTGDGKTCKVIESSARDSEDDVPWIIYVVIAIMVVLIVFLIVVLIYCEKKHKKRHRLSLDYYNNGINMYPRSTSYLAETPESEADLADGLGIVNRRGPQPNMVTFNPSPEEKKELDLQNGHPGMLLSFKRIDPE